MSFKGLAVLLPALLTLGGASAAEVREDMTPIPCEAPAVCRPAGDSTINMPDGSPAPVRRSAPTAYISGDAITLMPGEVITLRLAPRADGSLQPTLISVEAADMAALAPFLESNLRGLKCGAGPDNLYAVKGGQRFDTPPGVIRLTFIQAPGKPDSFLIVEDGYGAMWLRYHAFMVTPRGGRATDVCDVQAPRYGVEHWPHPILILQLSRLKLVDPQLDAAGQPVTHCE